jgi:hypothetical protein
MSAQMGVQTLVEIKLFGCDGETANLYRPFSLLEGEARMRSPVEVNIRRLNIFN